MSKISKKKKKKRVMEKEDLETGFSASSAMAAVELKIHQAGITKKEWTIKCQNKWTTMTLKMKIDKLKRKRERMWVTIWMIHLIRVIIIWIIFLCRRVSLVGGE